jgi:hypothetical protein
MNDTPYFRDGAKATVHASDKNGSAPKGRIARELQHQEVGV